MTLTGVSVTQLQSLFYYFSVVTRFVFLLVCKITENNSYSSINVIKMHLNKTKDGCLVIALNESPTFFSSAYKSNKRGQ